MNLPDDVLAPLRAAVQRDIANIEWIEKNGKKPLKDDGYSRLEMTVGDVRRLHAALCAEEAQ